MGFEAYKFKPADVVAGLNKYYGIKKTMWTNHFKVKVPSGYRAIVFSDAKVSEAINWLREEHDIFYTPGMEVPREDCDIFCEGNLDMVPITRVREALGIVDEYVDILGTIRKLREERNELKEKYDRLYMSYEKTYRAKFAKLSEERDRYKWLYENLKDGMESVLQEAEERED